MFPEETESAKERNRKEKKKKSCLKAWQLYHLCLSHRCTMRKNVLHCDDSTIDETAKKKADNSSGMVKISLIILAHLITLFYLTGSN